MKMRVKDAAERLGVSPRTVYRWVASGRVSGHRLKGKLMVEFEVQTSSPHLVPLATEEEVPVTVLSPVTTAALAAASCPPAGNSGSPQRELAFNWRTHYRLAF
jgi:excisionase family DNA binding protein